MKNKVEKLSIAFALAFTIASCGSDDDNPTSENQKPVAEVSITGDDFTVGQELTASAKSDDEDGDEVTLKYQWYRSIDNKLEKEGDSPDTAIEGATESTYKLVDDDVDSYIIVEVIPKDDKGLEGDPVSEATSDKVKAAENQKPVVSKVSITGDAAIGQELTASAESEDGDNVTFKYQWYSANDDKGEGEAKIDKATSEKYTLDGTSISKGKYITVGVTPKDDEVEGEEVKADWKMVVNTAPVAVVSITREKGGSAATGAITAGETLTADTSLSTDADGDAITYKYQWYQATDADGTGETEISGATNNTYTTAAADNFITVKVIPNDGEEDGDEVKADYVGS